MILKCTFPTVIRVQWPENGLRTELKYQHTSSTPVPYLENVLFVRADTETNDSTYYVPAAFKASVENRASYCSPCFQLVIAAVVAATSWASQASAASVYRRGRAYFTHWDIKISTRCLFMQQP